MPSPSGWRTNLGLGRAPILVRERTYRRAHRSCGPISRDLPFADHTGWTTCLPFVSQLPLLLFSGFPVARMLTPRRHPARTIGALPSVRKFWWRGVGSTPSVKVGAPLEVGVLLVNPALAAMT